MAEGRRQRVRAKVAKAGIQILAPHEQLEFFIYPFLPRRDTVPIARQLLAVFGSVGNVLGAPYEELIKIKGMPRLAARTLSLLREIVTEECLLCPSFYVHGANQAAGLIYREYATDKKECLFALVMDKDATLLNLIPVWTEDEPFSVMTIIPKIITSMLRAGGDVLLLAHCGADATEMSNEDESLVAGCVHVFASFKFLLSDYLTITPNGRFRACGFNFNFRRTYLDGKV